MHVMPLLSFVLVLAVLLPTQHAEPLPPTTTVTTAKLDFNLNITFDDDGDSSPNASPDSKISLKALFGSFGLFNNDPSLWQSLNLSPEIKALIPSWLENFLKSIRKSDLDGIKNIAKDLLSGKIKNLAQLKSAVFWYEPGLYFALRNLKYDLLDMLFSVYDKQPPSIKDELSKLFAKLKEIFMQAFDEIIKTLKAIQEKNPDLKEKLMNYIQDLLKNLS